MVDKLVLAVIPARGGSKSIPNKNLLQIHGISITKYALFSAQLNNQITHIALSSDSDEILGEIESFKESRFIQVKRPTELSSDESPDQPMLEHALRFSENKFKVKFAVVVMLQPTSPVRSQKDIDSCIKKVFKPTIDSSWTVSEVPVRFHFKKQFVIKNKRLTIATSEGHVPRRQDLKSSFHRDGACYAYKRWVILNDPLLMGNNCEPVISEVITNDIDNFEDFYDLEKSTFCRFNQLYWK